MPRQARHPPRPAPGQVAPSVPSDQSLARERQVLELRRSGLTMDVIAEQVGYKNRGSVHHALTRALTRTLQQPAAELRDLEADRLDRIQAVLWPMMLRGDLKAVDRILRVMERRARLLGLDHADGIAERAQALDERMGALLVAGMGQFLADLGMADDERARSAAAAMFERLHVVRELDNVIEGELVEEPKAPVRRPRKTTTAKAPA